MSHVAITVLPNAVVEAVQAASVLGDGSSPRDWKRQKQGVQARIVEALTNVLAGGQNHSGILAWDARQPIDHGLPLLLAHPGSQDHEVTHAPDQPTLKTVEMVVSLREHQW